MSKKKTVANTVVDPTIRFATIELGEESFKLAYSFNSIAECEAKTGVNLLEGLNDLNNINAAMLRGLLWSAMIVAQPDTTIEDAGNLITFKNKQTIYNGIVNAYLLSMPDWEESTEDPTTPNQTA
jgi:hypothetical protein